MAGEEEQKQPTEANTLEALRTQLVEAIDQEDKALGGRLVTRFPTKDGRDVLIFSTVISERNAEPHQELTHAGVHPDQGAIFVTKGQLSIDIERIKPARKTGESIGLTQLPWEDLVDSSNSPDRLDKHSADSQVIDVSPDQEDVWKNTYIATRSVAEQEMRFEENQRQVTPDLLSFLNQTKTAQTSAGQAEPPEMRPAPSPSDGEQQP